MLALFLLVPFILREVYSRAEPYPAVLLPSGAGRIYVGTGEVNCGNLELLAVFNSGEEKRIDPRNSQRHSYACWGLRGRVLETVEVT